MQPFSAWTLKWVILKTVSFRLECGVTFYQRNFGCFSNFEQFFRLLAPGVIFVARGFITIITHLFTYSSSNQVILSFKSKGLGYCFGRFFEVHSFLDADCYHRFDSFATRLATLTCQFDSNFLFSVNILEFLENFNMLFLPNRHFWQNMRFLQKNLRHSIGYTYDYLEFL